MDAVRKQKPDIVLLGGDIFDDNGTYDNAEITIRQLAEQYPCYYVTGNHEYWSQDVAEYLVEGVTVGMQLDSAAKEAADMIMKREL